MPETSEPASGLTNIGGIGSNSSPVIVGDPGLYARPPTGERSLQLSGTMVSRPRPSQFVRPMLLVQVETLLHIFRTGGLTLILVGQDAKQAQLSLRLGSPCPSPLTGLPVP